VHRLLAPCLGGRGGVGRLGVWRFVGSGHHPGGKGGGKTVLAEVVCYDN
jgi:hypothetical protein